jgi:hypothetical protein
MCVSRVRRQASNRVTELVRWKVRLQRRVVGDLSIFQSRLPREGTTNTGIPAELGNGRQEVDATDASLSTPTWFDGTTLASASFSIRLRFVAMEKPKECTRGQETPESRIKARTRRECTERCARFFCPVSLSIRISACEWSRTCGFPPSLWPEKGIKDADRVCRFEELPLMIGLQRVPISHAPADVVMFLA